MSTRFYRSGSMVTDTATDILSFWAYATAGKYGTLRKAAATSGYQVTSGKTLYITKIVYLNATSATARQYALLYGDTDVGFDGAVAPTNSVKVVGDTADTRVPFAGPTGAGSDFSRTLDVFIPIAPSAKYPCVLFVGTAGSIYLEGFEA